MSITMAKNEPRIALIRNSAFGFNGKACLEKRMLNAIKFRKLFVCPPARRRRRPRQTEYVTAHNKPTSPISRASRAYTLRLERGLKKVRTAAAEATLVNNQAIPIEPQTYHIRQ